MEKLNVEKLHISNTVFNLKQTSILILIIQRDTETTGKKDQNFVLSLNHPSDCLYRIFLFDSFTFLFILNILFKLTCVSSRIKEVQIT